MELFEASILAKDLMGKYAPIGYTFAWMNKKNVNGQCSYAAKQILLSRQLTPLRTEAAVRQTIIHEICHARVGPGNGHGTVWQNEMRKFGYKPERCTSDAVDRSTISNWKATCIQCKSNAYMVRKPRQEKICGPCYKFTGRQYLLTFVRI
jgi:predicted SprT family Zn-dependent metalloprotease